MRDDPDSVMIFAAGFGTRMGGLTRECPKPLLKVAGRTLIDHTLDLVDEIHPKKIVMNLHYLPDMMIAHLGSKPIKTIVEKPNILDTGGGLKNALPEFEQSSVFTSNCDVIWDGPNPFRLLRENWDPERMDALLGCIRVENCVGRLSGGDFSITPDGRIQRCGNFVYGGVQILKTAPISTHPNRTFSLNAIWDEIASKGRLYGLTYPGRWCDVGHPEGIKLADAMKEGRNV